uniref:Uncharacterized protein 51w n=1 Tax=Yarrowia lipolytica TaxID=4952 RepID=Q9UVF0_YARLL|nr:hypothetical protein [Yarrowia lipolytica]
MRTPQDTTHCMSSLDQLIHLPVLVYPNPTEDERLQTSCMRSFTSVASFVCSDELSNISDSCFCLFLCLVLALWALADTPIQRPCNPMLCNPMLCSYACRGTSCSYSMYLSLTAPTGFASDGLK